MLKLTVEAGEYLQIGENVKVIFVGGSNKIAKVLIDAPKSVNIARSKAMEKYGTEEVKKRPVRKYEADADLSEEAKRKIRAIISEERSKAKNARP